MASIYKPTYTKPLPADAELFTRRGQRFARWRDRNGKRRTAAITVPDSGKNAGQEWITLEGQTYRIKYRGADGLMKNVAGYRDRKATEALAGDLERRVERGEAGLVDPYEEHRKRPLGEHVDDFEEYLAGKRSSVHTDLTVQRIRRLIGEAEAGTWPKLTAEAIERALATITTDENLKPQTRNAYRTALHSFCGWMVKKKRAATNPCEGVERLDTEDREHRRALEPVEAERLIRAAMTGETMTGRGRDGSVRWELSGQQRATLWLFTLETALRRSAIARLTVGDLDLDSDDPSVTVWAQKNTKSRKAQLIPLRRRTAELLAVQVQARTPAAPAFVLPARWETADVLRADLAEARRQWIAEGPTPKDRAKRAEQDFLAETDAEERRIDFHALRTTAATWLDEAGVATSTASKITGHASERILSKHYHRSNQRQLREAVESMPSIELAQANAANAAGSHSVLGRATGTDDATPGAVASNRNAQSGLNAANAANSDSQPLEGSKGQAGHSGQPRLVRQLVRDGVTEGESVASGGKAGDAREEESPDRATPAIRQV